MSETQKFEKRPPTDEILRYLEKTTGARVLQTVELSQDEGYRQYKNGIVSIREFIQYRRSKRRNEQRRERTKSLISSQLEDPNEISLDPMEIRARMPLPTGVKKRSRLSGGRDAKKREKTRMTLEDRLFFVDPEDQEELQYIQGAISRIYGDNAEEDPAAVSDLLDNETKMLQGCFNMPDIEEETSSSFDLRNAQQNYVMDNIMDASGENEDQTQNDEYSPLDRSIHSLLETVPKVEEIVYCSQDGEDEVVEIIQSSEDVSQPISTSSVRFCSESAHERLKFVQSVLDICTKCARTDEMKLLFMTTRCALYEDFYEKQMDIGSC